MKTTKQPKEYRRTKKMQNYVERYSESINFAMDFLSVNPHNLFK
jgi:hypothetical protein